MPFYSAKCYLRWMFSIAQPMCVVYMTTIAVYITYKLLLAMHGSKQHISPRIQHTTLQLHYSAIVNRFTLETLSECFVSPHKVTLMTQASATCRQTLWHCCAKNYVCTCVSERHMLELQWVSMCYCQLSQNNLRLYSKIDGRGPKWVWE